ncbi:hypothetical protein AWZ03_014569, partial [Drosophila navojoa]
IFKNLSIHEKATPRRQRGSSSSKRNLVKLVLGLTKSTAPMLFLSLLLLAVLLTFAAPASSAPSGKRHTSNDLCANKMSPSAAG